TPIAELWWVRRLRANGSGTYPSRVAACRTRATVWGWTGRFLEPLSAREAVARWTPAARATSRSVGLPLGGGSLIWRSGLVRRVGPAYRSTGEPAESGLHDLAAVGDQVSTKIRRHQSAPQGTPVERTPSDQRVQRGLVHCPVFRRVEQQQVGVGARGQV